MPAGDRPQPVRFAPALLILLFATSSASGLASIETFREDWEDGADGWQGAPLLDCDLDRPGCALVARDGRWAALAPPDGLPLGVGRVAATADVHIGPEGWAAVDVVLASNAGGIIAAALRHGNGGDTLGLWFEDPLGRGDFLETPIRGAVGWSTLELQLDTFSDTAVLVARDPSGETLGVISAASPAKSYDTVIIIGSGDEPQPRVDDLSITSAI